MVDAQHADFALRLVDATQDPKGASPGGPDTIELATKWLPNSVGILEEGTSDRGDDGSRDRFREGI